MTTWSDHAAPSEETWWTVGTTTTRERALFWAEGGGLFVGVAGTVGGVAEAAAVAVRDALDAQGPAAATPANWNSSPHH